MPKYRCRYLPTPPPSRFPVGFYQTRDQFRARGWDLWSDGPCRYVCRDGDVVLRVWRTVGEALAWLQSTPVSSAKRSVNDAEP